MPSIETAPVNTIVYILSSSLAGMLLNEARWRKKTNRMVPTSRIESRLTVVETNVHRIDIRTETHEKEIDRLRDSVHKMANIVSTHQATMENLGENLDKLLDTTEKNNAIIWEHIDKQADAITKLSIKFAEQAGSRKNHE